MRLTLPDTGFAVPLRAGLPPPRSPCEDGWKDFIRHVAR